MRTTLDLSDEAYAIAKAIARERNVGLGRAISDVILSLKAPPAQAAARVEIVDGLPLVSVGRLVTSEDVRAILDESE